jgi:L-seryl-tRNA(Ser) seleniumtransferase
MLKERAGRLAALCPPWSAATVIAGESAVGGGSFPAASLPTHLVALTPPALGADALALRLRLGRPPVVARVADGRVLLDPRTLTDDDLPVVGAVLADLDLA